MDVSDSAWQSLVGGTIPAALVEKGVDGFFVDNTDVYYQYPDTRIYQGLKTILYGIAKYEMPVIINGGDTFVTAMIGKGETLPFTGVNQEGVFTTIEDYETDTFSTQTEENRKYFQTYLKHCKEAGLDVYLLEYTVDTELMQEIADYAQEKGYSMYISATVGLDET